MEPEIKIGRLDPSDRESILKIAHWYLEEWNTPIEKTLHRLGSQSENDILFQLVLTIDNELIATGGLYNDVNLIRVHMELKKFGPWVGMLYTREQYRNYGFGSMLLTDIERRASERNLKKIYLYTFTAESLYRRCGWTEIDRVPYKDHMTAVMEKAI